MPGRVDTSGNTSNYPTIPLTDNQDNDEQTFGTEFRLSVPCALDNIWYYSSPPVSPPALPTMCAIWNVQTRQVVSVTQNSAVVVRGGGKRLGVVFLLRCHAPAGDYKVTVYTPGGSTNFCQETEDHFSSGAGANGIVSGPLSAPSAANATSPGQITYHHGGFAYLDTYDTGFNGQNRWVDVEVTRLLPRRRPSTPRPSWPSSPESLRLVC